MAYSASNPVMEKSNHNKWYQSSSDPRELLEASAETTDSDVSRTLVVTIEDIRFPVTIEVLHRVFDQLGVVEDIEIHHGKETIQALVRFQVLSHANSAKTYLDGRCIFDGCCFMHIQFLSEINVEELLDQNIAIMKFFQAVLDMRKEISVKIQKIRDTLSKPRNVRKNIFTPTILLDKTSVAEFVHMEKEADKSVGKETLALINTQVFDEMSVSEIKNLTIVEMDIKTDETEGLEKKESTVVVGKPMLEEMVVKETVEVFDDMPVSGPDMFDDMHVSGAEESEKVEINSNRFDEFPMKNIEQLKSINVGSKVFVAKDLIEMKKVDAIETGRKVLDEMIRIDESEDSQTNIMENVEGCYLNKDKICLLSDDGIGFGGFLIEPGGFVETDIGVEHKKWGESGFNILMPWQNAMSSYTCKNKLLGNSQTDMAEKDKKLITWGNVEQVVLPNVTTKKFVLQYVSLQAMPEDMQEISFWISLLFSCLMAAWGLSLALMVQVCYGNWLWLDMFDLIINQIESLNEKYGGNIPLLFIESLGEALKVKTEEQMFHNL